MTESSPRRPRRRCLVLVVLVTLAVVANVSLATYVYFFYDGSSKDVAPGDAQLLTDYINNFFCKAEQVQLESHDPSLRFDASVISGNRLNDRVPKTDRVNLSPVLKANHEADFWPFDLSSGSQLSVQQCTSGTTTCNKVMSAIVKGQDVDKDCIKYMWEKYILGEDESSFYKPCPEIILQPYLLQHCSDSNQQMRVKINQRGYYSLIFDNISPLQIQVISNISISRLTYDLRSSLANCTSTRFCILPLRFWSSDTVIVEVAMTPKASKVSINGSCIRQSASFATVFAGLPLLLFVLIIVIVSCRRKKKRPGSTSSQPDSTRGESERAPLLDTVDAQRGTVPSYGASAVELPDPILAKVGPIPGPYQYRPSAPPDFSPETLTTDVRADDQSLAYPTEPPPTYEETMNTEPEDQNNPFTKES